MNISSETESKINRDQLMTLGDLEKFKVTLLEEIKVILKELSSQPNKKWLKSSDVRKMLGVSPGTLQNLRVNGTLAFSKIGGLVFYRYDDIVNLLESSNSKGYRKG